VFRSEAFQPRSAMPFRLLQLLIENSRENAPRFRLHLHKWPQVTQSPSNARLPSGDRRSSIIVHHSGRGG
jgi:hypothetical protein